MFLLQYFVIVWIIISYFIVSPVTITANNASWVLSSCRHLGLKPCEGVKYTLDAETGNNITIIFNMTNHQPYLLNDIIKFSGINGIVFEGQNNSILCNNTKASGLVFDNCSNVVLKNFTIENCTSQTNPHAERTNLRAKRIYIQAILLKDTQNVNIQQVNFTHNYGRGLSLYNVGGFVNISHCNFLSNGNLPPELQNLAATQVIGQGGMIYVINTPPYSEHYITIIKCNFFDNINSVNRREWAHTDAHGGGLQIFLRNANNVSLKMTNCTFRNNTAILAAGLKIIIRMNSSNNTVCVEDTVFEKNTALPSPSGGGGADIGFNTTDVELENIILLKHCRFIENQATFGGGLALYTGSKSSKKVPNSAVNNIQIEFCSFSKNIANGGSAVDINRNTVVSTGNSFITAFTFKSCNFTDNLAGLPNYFVGFATGITQTGTIFTSQVTSTFEGATIFKNNYGSALYISYTSVTFAESSMTNFTNNTSIKGGAILLAGKSKLEFKNSSKVDFFNNTATYGGAIATIKSETQYFEYTTMCFIYRDVNATTEISFDNNTATSNIGADIFVSTLKPCICSPDVNTNYSNLFDICFGIHFGNLNHSVATYTSKITVAKNHIYPQPGIPYSLDIKQYDEYNKSLGTLFPLSTSLLRNKTGNVTIDSNYIIITTDTTLFYGAPESNATLILQGNNIKVAVEVMISQCAPGFVYNNKSKSCMCSAYDKNTRYHGIPFCNNTIPVLAVNTWAGYIFANKSHEKNEDNFFTGNCVSHLCSFNNSVLPIDGHYLLNNSLEQDRYVCSQNRQGVLCTDCVNDTVNLYHSTTLRCYNKSASCKVGFLLYILLELLPVTVMFVIILIFDINITSGAVQTFIFYSQIVCGTYIDAFGAVKIKGGFKEFLSSFYYIVYGIANFNILNHDELSFCLFEYANILDLHMFRYVTTIYTIVLIFVTIGIIRFNSFRFCIKLCHKFGRRNIKHSMINGLTAFLSLAYYHCIMTTYILLIPVNLMGKHSAVKYTRPLFAGNMTYMEGDHLKYAIPAIMFLIFFILPPPIFLTLEPLVVYLSGKIRIKRNNQCFYYFQKIQLKFKPFLDSFQGCFKDNCRCFGGLFFLYRVAVILPVVFAQSIFEHLIYITMILIGILILHGIVKPFQKSWHNKIDFCLLSNLLITQILTIINLYADSLDKHNVVKNSLNLQLFLLGCPLVYMGGYVVYLAYKKCGCKKIDKMWFNRWEDSNYNEDLPSRLLDADKSFCDKYGTNSTTN
jgi:hypothetical protein